MLTIYTIAYNEEIMLPFMIKWYRERFSDCKIVVYDNYSTDNTEKIALENNCTVIKYDSNNEIRDDLYLEIKNNCWKTANTNWVLICDTDELLDINEQQLQEENCSIIKAKGYNMVNLENNLNIESIKYGIRATQYDKYYLFNKNKIKEINYQPGCHSANPKGDIKLSETIYNLYHYNMLSEEYLVNRYKEYSTRLSKQNIKHGWGFHYKQNEQFIRDKFIVARKWFNENKNFDLNNAINISDLKKN